MAIWFDKFLSRLGLDASRPDRVQGAVIREFPPIGSPPLDEWLQVSLCRLPDGRTLCTFQISSSGERWVGFLPCSRANLNLLQSFLADARSHSPRSTTVLGSLRDSKTPLAVLGPLPDRHLDTGVELKLLDRARKDPELQFFIRGPRGHLRRELAWTPDLASWWEALAKEVAAHISAWPSTADSKP